MLIHILMKTPDVLDDSIDRALEDESTITKHELRILCAQWFEYGETVHLVVDTANNTCTVERLT